MVCRRARSPTPRAVLSPSALKDDRDLEGARRKRQESRGSSGSSQGRVMSEPRPAVPPRGPEGRRGGPRPGGSEAERDGGSDERVVREETDTTIAAPGNAWDNCNGFLVDLKKSCRFGDRAERAQPNTSLLSLYDHGDEVRRRQLGQQVKWKWVPFWMHPDRWHNSAVCIKKALDPGAIEALAKAVHVKPRDDFSERIKNAGFVVDAASLVAVAGA